MQTEEIQNYLKFHLLLVDTIPSHLRKIFQDTWLTFSRNPWGNTPTDGKELVGRLGKKFYSKEMKIQKQYLQSGDINKWDFPFLAKVINQLASQDPSLTPENIAKLQALSTLVQIRNKFGHIGTPFLSADDYNSNWTDVVEVLEQFGITEEELETSSTSQIVGVTQVSHKNTNEAKKIKEIGNKLLGNGDITTAIVRYSEALLLTNIHPDEQAIIYSNRSKAYLDLEVTDTDHAIEDAEQAINLHPRWWKCYFRSATAYEAVENFQKAIKFFSIALALNPGGTEIEKRVGFCRFRKSLSEIESKDLYRSVKECAETYLNEKESKNEKISDKMIEEAKEKLKTENSYLGLIVKGHENRESKKFQEAYESFQQAETMGSNGKNAEALYNLAMLKMNERLKNGTITENIQSLEKAAMQDTSGNIGVAESQFILGLYFQMTTQSFEKVLLWYKKSAKNLNGLAANQLGMLYDEGVLFAMNKNMAVEFWNKAADSKQKVLPAMESLSRHFLETFEFELAIKWHTTAVENGSKVLSVGKDNFKADVNELETYYTDWKMTKTLEERYKSPEDIETAKGLKIRVDVKIKNILQDHFKYHPRNKSSPLTLTAVTKKFSIFFQTR